MKLAFALCGVAAASWVAVGVQDPPQPEHPKKWTKIEVTHKYVGITVCMDCHDSKTKTKSYEQWSKGPHAKAFEALASEKAKEIAKARGIEDAQKAPECLKCHTTGYGQEEKWYGKQFKLSEGISCEACHGPGDDYQPKAIHGKSRDKAIAKGMVIPDERTCRNCHNAESPTAKKFDYKEFRKKIMHWAPREIDK